MTFERILSHFQVRKRGTGKAQCICPAHADTEASLTLTDGNDRALISLNGLTRNMNTIGNEMSNNLINGISGAVTGIAGILNEVVSKVNSTISNVNSSLSGIEKAFTFSYDVTTPDGKRRWGKYSMNLPRVNTVPYLAKGAVIPPRSEFLAVLGDQKQGNNIETPEALLRKIVREETAGRQTGGGNYRFTAQINRRTLFDEMMKEAQMRRDTSGRNPFEMA